MLSLVMQVASEDTVLYTVRRYMACASDAASKQRIRERLGPLIRCQHLSLYWLMLSAFSEDAGSMPLAQLQPQLKPLVMLRNANPRVTASELKELLKYPPSSWLLAPRSRHPVSAVQLTWELDVSKLREAAQRSAAQQEECRLTSPGITPPLGGVVFGMVVVCKPEQVDSTPAVKVGLDAVALGLPHDASCCVTMKMSVAGVIPYPFDTQMLNSGDRLGWDDLLDLGPMAGGWDEVGWASKGLPTSGPVVLKLSVTGVGHMARTDTDAG